MTTILVGPLSVLMRRRLIGLALALVLAPLAAHAEIYKCVGKGGRLTFQDSPCLGVPGTTVTVRPQVSGVVVVTPKETPPPPTGPAAPAKDKEGAGAPATAMSPAQRDAARLKVMESDRRRRAIDYDLTEAETALETLKASMEQDLSTLRGRQQAVSGTQPGSALEMSAANDVQSASDRYALQIRTAQDRIAQLRKSRDELSAIPQSDRRTDASSGAKP